MIYWIVKMGNIHVIVNGYGREVAKERARSIIGGDKETYTVTPLTKKGDRLWINIAVQV